MALLSACATKPQLSTEQETSRYLSRASRTYTAPGPASDPWGPYITEAAAKYDVPERWIREVMRQESGGRLYGRNGDLITSGAGAMGLMQVMPGTYDDLRGRYRELGDDPFDPHNNILAGTAYIREMYDIYGAPGFLAAYNAGPGRLDDYLTRNRTLPEETRRYVASIGPRIAGSSPSTPSPGEQYAMNAVPFNIPAGTRYARANTNSADPRYSMGTAMALNGGTYVPRAAAPSAPVQLAQLEPPRQPIVLSPPAPIQMAPIQMAPVQVAQIPEPPAQPIVLAPQPVQLAALPEPPLQPIVLSPPRPVEPRQYEQRPVEVAQAPERAPRSPFRRADYAQLPEPPRPVSAPAQRYAAAAALVPLGPRSSFALISPASAAPVQMGRGGFTQGGWAVQVGAFANPGLATAATAAAREHVRDVLGSARPAVASVRQANGTLYRARLTGLSRDAAAHACERLARSRTNCMVVSPDAQF